MTRSPNHDSRFDSAVSPVVEPLEQRQMMASHPLSAVPQLQSLPGASTTLYLDFNGHYMADRWTKLTNGNECYPGSTPAYDTNGLPSTFSDQELGEIRRMWEFVAERFSPFNINVTTKPAPHYSELTNNKEFVVVVGGNGHWYNSKANSSGAIGVAIKGSFYNNYYNLGFVFSKHSALDADDQLVMSQAIAHEAGHGFGLDHQSDWVGNTLVEEYGKGNGSASPIMGNNTTPDRITWWQGPTDEGPNVIQNDVSFLASLPNVGYRPDDYGGSVATAPNLLQLEQGVVGRRGVIEKRYDTDAFKFNNGNATKFSIRVERTNEKGMLNGDLSVVRGSTFIGAATTNAADETLVLSGQAKNGSYGIVVKGHGGVGDLGQYRVKVLAANIVGASSVFKGFNTAFVVQDFGPTANYRWDLDGDGIFGETGANASRGSEVGRAVMHNSTGVATGNHTIRCRVSRPDGMSSEAETVLQVKLPTLSITATDPNAGEGAYKGSNGLPLAGGMYRISRDGPTLYPLDVYLSTSGTATRNVDFSVNAIAADGKVTIPASKSYIDIPLTVLNDTLVETQEVAMLQLLDKANYDVSPAQYKAGVVINSDDLAAPSNLQASNIQKKSLKLTWKDNTYNETYWVLRRSTSANFADATDTYLYNANGTSTASTTVSGLQAGTVYYFKLKAVNGNGESAWSSQLFAVATNP